MKHICYPCCGVPSCIKMLLHSIESLAKHNKDITIHLLNSNKIYKEVNGVTVHEEMEFSNEIIQKIKNILIDNDIHTNLYVYDVTDCMDIFYDLIPLHNQFNAYKRLLLPKLFNKHHPDVNILLYLDEDTLIDGDISKYYIDFKNTNFIGSYDILNTTHIKDIQYYDFKGNYINSGVLLVNLEKEIYDTLPVKINLSSIYYNILHRYDILHDQFIINMYNHVMIVTHGNIKFNHLYVAYFVVLKTFGENFNIYHYHQHKLVPFRGFSKHDELIDSILSK